MKFFICNDRSKFTKLQPENYGGWFFIREPDVEIWEGEDCIVLYCGYLIEGDIQEVCKEFSFKEANGNFFAVKLTKDNYEISVDYFQNHKLFVSTKYGTEISNHIPYMTIEDIDHTRIWVESDDYGREYSDAARTTYYDHISIFNPQYNYIQDAKDSHAQEVWQDLDELTEYIHQCMQHHSEVIKEKYPLRYCSLSEGIDSALQSVFFPEDLQLLYTVDTADSEQHYDLIKLAQNNFPNTNRYTYKSRRNRKDCLTHLIDSSCRWTSIIPTFRHLNMQKIKPDIFMYGVNGNEMFVRDLIPHVLVLFLKYYSSDTSSMIDKIKSDIYDKGDMYGSAYTNSVDYDFEGTVDTCIEMYRGLSYEEIEDILMILSTPKLYTRTISSNNNVLSASLYNDRRIFHEVMKGRNDWLETNAMDAPIMRAILDKYDYNFVTPRNCTLSADYEQLNYTAHEATVERDIRQNI